jgi:hypothetical protein
MPKAMKRMTRERGDSSKNAEEESRVRSPELKKRNKKKVEEEG